MYFVAKRENGQKQGSRWDKELESGTTLCGIAVTKGKCSLQRCNEFFFILDLMRMGTSKDVISILFWVGAVRAFGRAMRSKFVYLVVSRKDVMDQFDYVIFGKGTMIDGSSTGELVNGSHGRVIPEVSILYVLQEFRMG